MSSQTKVGLPLIKVTEMQSKVLRFEIIFQQAGLTMLSDSGTKKLTCSQSFSQSAILSQFSSVSNLRRFLQEPKNYTFTQSAKTLDLHWSFNGQNFSIPKFSYSMKFEDQILSEDDRLKIANQILLNQLKAHKQIIAKQQNLIASLSIQKKEVVIIDYEQDMKKVTGQKRMTIKLEEIGDDIRQKCQELNQKSQQEEEHGNQESNGNISEDKHHSQIFSSHRDRKKKNINKNNQLLAPLPKNKKLIRKQKQSRPKKKKIEGQKDHEVKPYPTFQTSVKLNSKKNEEILLQLRKQKEFLQKQRKRDKVVNPFTQEKLLLCKKLFYQIRKKMESNTKLNKPRFFDDFKEKMKADLTRLNFSINLIHVADRIYVGEVKKGLENGLGCGGSGNDCYIGDWLEGKAHGKGKYMDPSGNQFIGSYVNDEKHGYGIDIFKNGDRYEGFFVRDERSGFGIYSFKNGQYFEGYWKANKAEGPGIQFYRDGRYFEGVWRNDQKNGEGFFYDQDGNKTRQIWNQGVLESELDIISSDASHSRSNSKMQEQ